MEDAKKFGTRIRVLRIKANLTQRKLAEKLNVNFSYLSKIESGIFSPPSERLILEMAEILNADKDELTILAGKVPLDIVQILTEDSRLDFGERIRVQRKKQCLTQLKLAEKVGIDHTYLSKIETGIMPPPTEKVIILIAKVLNIGKDELFAAAGKISSDTKEELKDQKTLQVLRSSLGRKKAKALRERKGFIQRLGRITALPEAIVHNKFPRVIIAAVLVVLVGTLLWFSAPVADTAVSANNQGFVYNENGEFQKAITALDKAIELNPTFAPAYSNRGWAYIELGQYEQALTDCNKAIELDPTLALAYNNRGWAYIELGQYEQALPECNKAIELDPVLAFAYSNRGKVYIELGQYEQAVADLDKAMELDANLRK
ncbi:tetratricopeptide repeat protein [Chloroflexota bacterium]